MSKSKQLELGIERILFSSRWLMAPLYLGLSTALFLLMFAFLQEIWHLFAGLPDLSPNDIILGILSLIDLSLAGNLLLIVIFSGYENFVSKMEFDGHEDRPEWQGTVDFSTLKMKLIASIVAISGIHLLKTFMNMSQVPESEIKWMAIIHVVFVLSGVLMALMDRIGVGTKSLKKK